MNYNEFFKNEFVEKKFDTPFGEVTVPKDIMLYNALTKRLLELQKDAQNKFKELYEKHENWQDAYENIDNDFYESIIGTVNEITSYYITNGIFDKSKDDIIDDAQQYSDVLGKYKELRDAFQSKVESTQEELQTQSQINEYNTANRAKWSGNTTKTSIQAGALNIFEGALFTAIDAASESAAEKSANKNLNAIFLGQDFKDKLSESVNSALAALWSYFNSKISDDLDGYDVNSMLDPEKIQKSENIIENLKSGLIEEEYIADLCKGILTTNPFNYDFYIFLDTKYGDDGRISALADNFNVGKFNIYKVAKAACFLKEKFNDDLSEEELKQLREEFIDYCKQIFLNEETAEKAAEPIDERLKKIDEEKRTVDDYICSTHEAASKAREELSGIQEFMKDITPVQGEISLLYEKELLAKREEFDKTFSSELKDKYLEVFDRYLEDFDNKFCKSKLIGGKRSREQAARDRALEFVKKGPIFNMEQYEKMVQSLKDYVEPNLGITFEEAVEARDYLEKKRIKLTDGGLLKRSIKGFLK